VTAEAAEPAPLRAGTIAAAIASIAIAGLGLALSLPLISLRMEAAGFSSFAIGMNAAMAGLSSLVSAPFVPSVAHRVGTRTMLFVALALGAACLVAFPLSPFWAWFPIRFAFGVSITVLFVMSEFWITAAAPEARRGLVMGIYATVLALGFAGGPLLLQAVGTQGFAPFVAGAAVFAVAAIPVALAGGNAPDVEGKAEISILSFLRAAPAATLAGFVYGAVETGAFSLLPVYAEQLGLGAVVATTLVTALSLGHVAFQIPLGWLADRVNRVGVLIGCGLVGILGAAALPFVAPGGGVPLYALLFVWGGLIAGLYTIGLSLLGQRYAGPELATANAAFVALYSLGMLAGPSTMGSGMDWMGPHGLPVTIAVFFVGYCMASVAGVVAERQRGAGGAS
jgi:MFS family permease